MKLREIIKEIPDDDWLEIIEHSSINLGVLYNGL